MVVWEMHCKSLTVTLRQRFLHRTVTGGQSPNLLQSGGGQQAEGVETLVIPTGTMGTDYKPSTSSLGMRTASRQVPGKQDSPFMLYLGKQMTRIEKERKKGGGTENKQPSNYSEFL